jgi:uncharacterized protein YciI
MALNAKFSSQPFVQGPLKGRGNREKRKKDQAAHLARLKEIKADALARRSQMTPEGPKVDINPWNKS